MATTSIRIAFTGSHSTGKTTTLRALRQKFEPSQTYVIEETARRIIHAGFPLGKDASSDSYVMYMRDQLRAERGFLTSGKHLLFSDRTILDIWAYSQVNASLPRPYIANYFLDLIAEVAIASLRLYQVFVYFPIEFPLTPDPVRSNDDQYRNDVAAKLTDIMSSHNIPFVTAKGSTDERCETVLATIQGLR